MSEPQYRDHACDMSPDRIDRLREKIRGRSALIDVQGPRRSPPLVSGPLFELSTEPDDASRPPEADLFLPSPKKYECHITCDPIFLGGGGLKIAERIAKRYHFRVAKLYMKKRENDTPERSALDTFLTGNAVETSYDDLLKRAVALSKMLWEVLDIKTYRIKVEEIIFDERYDGVVE